MQSVDILEETNVTELVQLVVSDGLYSHVFAESEVKAMQAIDMALFRKAE